MTGTSMTAASAPDELKRLAAAAAVAEVEDGMVLGLGSGSTAALAVDALGKRVAEEGLKVVGVPTSERTAALARRLGVPLTSFAEHRRIDLTIDGADQVEVGSLNLVKGLGGALLREKIVAAASRRMLVVVDQGKLVGGLGGRTPLPVEIAAFGWQSTLDRLAGAGAQPVLRLTPDGGRSGPTAATTSPIAGSRAASTTRQGWRAVWRASWAWSRWACSSALRPGRWSGRPAGSGC